MKEINDIQVIRKIQNGNKELFIDIYEKYVEKIYNYVFYKTGLKQDAQDLTSEIFLKIYDNINKYNCNRKSNFSSWIFTIARNCLIDYFRSKEKTIDFDWILDHQNKDNLINNYDIKFKAQEVLRYLDSMGKEKKEIFLMRVWDGLTYDEISAILGKSVNNCKVTFHRTLNQLIDHFGLLNLIIFFIL